MEINNDEFQTLRLKVDQISSELDKQHAIRAVNTKWMIIVGSIIVAALGFTSFVQIPNQAKKAAKEQIGPQTIEQAEGFLSDIEKNKAAADQLLSDLKIANFNQLADKDGYAWVGSIKFVWGTRKSTKDGAEQFLFKPAGKSDELNFKNECFTVITSLASTSGRVKCEPTRFTLDRVNDYDKIQVFTFVAIGR